VLNLALSLGGLGVGVLPLRRTVLERYIRTFDGVNTYGTLNDSITLTGDFEIEVEFSFTDTSATTTMLGGALATGRISCNAGDGRVLANLLDSVGAGFNVIYPVTDWSDGDIHKVKVTRVGDLFSIYVDDVFGASVTKVGAMSQTFTLIGASAGGGAGLFNGEILSAKFTDKSGAGDVVTNYVLGNDSLATQYAVGEAPPSAKYVAYSNFIAGDVGAFVYNAATGCWEPVGAGVDLCYA